MAAPAGNKFWQNRSRHGREKLFASAELLWDAAEEYFLWCDQNPWMKKELMKSGEHAGDLIDVPTQRPYTLGGLCIYLGVNEAYFRTFKAQLPDGEKDFNTVISQIEQVIYTQKFEGAAVGAFNANIIARDLGLKEKSEVDHTTGGERIEIFRIPDNGREQTKNTEGESAAAGVPDEGAQQSG
jgi:hypothetical protein